MAAVAEIHAEDGVARLEQREVHGDIGLGAGVGLDVGVLGAEELFRPLDGEGLDLVHVLASAVVARAGIALGVLVGQMAAHGLHDGGRHKVLRGDQLDMVTLALKLAHHGGVDLRVLSLDGLIAHKGVPPCSFFMPDQYTTRYCAWQGADFTNPPLPLACFFTP